MLTVYSLQPHIYMCKKIMLTHPFVRGKLDFVDYKHTYYIYDYHQFPVSRQRPPSPHPKTTEA
jgi:hypothetical protein